MLRPIVFVVTVVAGLLVPRTAAAARPNVLLICADDHAPYMMGAYGNRVVRTPNLDRLAASGMRFDRAYCNSPVCTASRQSFLTGRYPRTIGVTLLETPLPESEVTLAEMLATAGYATAAIGKMHFNSQLQHGFEFRLDVPDHRLSQAGKPAAPLPAGVESLPVWRPFKDPARVWLNAGVLPYGAADAKMAGTWFAEQAAAWIRQPRDRPYFLVASFTEPHSPFHFPIEYRGRHRPDEFAVPAVGSDDDDQVPAVFRDLTLREKQGIAASYATSVEFLDKNVGLILEAVEQSGRAADTLVIYLGDHGYLLGQHGRFEKHCSFEEAVRAPLLIRYPGKVQPSTTDALVEFVDLVPTVLEWCGVPCPGSVQGRSLVPLLTGRKQTDREFVVAEYAPNDEAMIRDTRWKLVFSRGERVRTDGYDPQRPLPGPAFRLYDEERDPGEMTNLAGSAEHAAVFARLKSLLVQHLVATARQPELLPATGDQQEVLEYCVQPRDVTP